MGAIFNAVGVFLIGAGSFAEAIGALLTFFHL
jgi:hypothetical protein